MDPLLGGFGVNMNAFMKHKYSNFFDWAKELERAHVWTLAIAYACIMITMLASNEIARSAHTKLS